MKNKKLYQQIQKVLDEWDPIGILQDIEEIDYSEVYIGEYYKYIKPIINTYISGNSMCDFLELLHIKLRDEPNDLIKEEIKFVANQINEILSKFKIEDIQ